MTQSRINGKTLQFKAQLNYYQKLMFAQVLYFLAVFQITQANQKQSQLDSDLFLQPKKQFEMDKHSFETNLLEGPNQDEGYNYNTALYYHQYANFVVWAFLVDIGIIANRYGILLKNKLDIHGIIMFLCVIPSIVAEAIAIFAVFPEPQGEDEGLQGAHSLIGYIFLGLMLIQTIGGIIVKFCISSVNPQTHLKIKSILHIYFGYLIYLLGKIQLGFGYYITYRKDVNPGQANFISFWCIYALMFFWRSLFELFYYNGKLFFWFLRKQETPRQHSGTLQDSLLIQYIEQNEQSQIYTEFKNKFWLIFNNEIVDLTGYIHPGGQYIWEQVKGREVSRFIYGGAGLEDGTAKQWAHSKNALLLLKNNVIGSLNNVVFMQPIEENDSSLDTKWKLSTITKINDKTSYFGFTNSKYRIISQFKSIHFFGKYFQIQSFQTSNLPIRQYTCISSMAPENVAYRKELVKYIEYVAITKQQAQLPVQPKYLSELPLLIKCYETKNGFSQYIHQHKDEMYDIQGPFGPPHGIPNRGNVVIICGGTGIFPFLDLLDYILKTVINQIALKKFGKQMAESLNPFECEFNSNIHITLFFAVANKSELIGQDILFPIILLQKHLDKEYLRLIVKIKDKIEGIETIEERFSQELFSKYLGKSLDYQRFLICGPPQMQQTVPRILQDMGIEDQYIHFI